MLPCNDSDCIEIVFDDHRLVANAGLILPVTLAHHLGQGELVDRHVDLGDAPGRDNAGDKLLTLVAAALAGGDCVDDPDALPAGGSGQALGCTVKTPFTVPTDNLVTQSVNRTEDRNTCQPSVARFQRVPIGMTRLDCVHLHLVVPSLITRCALHDEFLTCSTVNRQSPGYSDTRLLPKRH